MRLKLIKVETAAVKVQKRGAAVGEQDVHYEVSD